MRKSSQRSPRSEALTREERRLASSPGVVAGMIGVPYALSMWAPAWVAFAWFGVYATLSAFGFVGGRFFPADRVDQIWTVGAGTLFALIPITAAIWGNVEEHQWVIALILTLYVATETAMAPYLHYWAWAAGIAQAVVATIVVAAVWVSPLLAFALAAGEFGVLGTARLAQRLNNQLRDERHRALKRSEMSEQLANEDELTRVLNRRGVTSLLEKQAIAATTVIMFDVNRFKVHNDTLGYVAGDQILQFLATTIQRRLGGNWSVGRLGGDEFIAITRGIVNPPTDLAFPVLCTLDSGAQVTVALSAGRVASPHPTTAEELLRQAAFTLQKAKRSSAVAVVEFDKELQGQFAQSNDFAAALATSLSDGRIFAHAQPIVDRGHIVGCELLARWRNDDGSLAHPADFLPVLAEHGLMRQLNRFMLRSGVEFAARFNHIDDAPFVSVNVTASDLAAPDLAHQVEELLREFKVEPERLMIEITESESLHYLSGWERTAHNFRDLGVLLAIDDFGSGYSSIERMNLLPITHLKFDQSLTHHVHGPLRAIIRGVVEFAETTGVGIIAEGIEHPEHLEAMQAIGITLMQGWHFGKAVGLKEMASAIAMSRRVAVSDRPNSDRPNPEAPEFSAAG